MEALLVVGVEAAPEDGIAFADGDSSRVEEGPTVRVELSLVVDDIGLVLHTLARVPFGEVEEFLFRVLPFFGGANVLLAELSAECGPAAVDVTWQRLPDVALGAIYVLDDRFYHFSLGESVLVGQQLVFLQEVLHRLFDFAREVRCEFGSHGGHAGDALW